MTDIILIELYISLIIAISACFWAFFFEPLNGPKERFLNLIVVKTKNKILVECASYLLYCPKCVAFWGGLGFSLVSGVPIFTSMKIALLSSVMAYLLTGVLLSETEAD